MDSMDSLKNQINKPKTSFYQLSSASDHVDVSIRAKVIEFLFKQNLVPIEQLLLDKTIGHEERIKFISRLVFHHSARYESLPSIDEKALTRLLNFEKSNKIISELVNQSFTWTTQLFEEYKETLPLRIFVSKNQRSRMWGSRISDAINQEFETNVIIEEIPEWLDKKWLQLILEIQGEIEGLYLERDFPFPLVIIPPTAETYVKGVKNL